MGKFRRSVFSFPRVIWFIPRTLLVWILPYFFFPFYLVDWRSWSEAPSKIESISCVYFWDESRALTPCEIVRGICHRTMRTWPQTPLLATQKLTFVEISGSAGVALYYRLAHVPAAAEMTKNVP